MSDLGECVVGRMYRVPHVRWVSRPGYYRPSSFPPEIPIIGPLHEDAEFINFPEDHWHIDWRFVPPRYFNSLYTYDTMTKDEAALVKPISRVNTDGQVFTRLRKCVRPPGVFSSHRAPWFARLEASYRDARVKCGICPHRGMPLAGAPIVNGAIRCPAHGLNWHPVTGALVPLEEPV